MKLFEKITEMINNWRAKRIAKLITQVRPTPKGECLLKYLEAELNETPMDKCEEYENAILEAMNEMSGTRQEAITLLVLILSGGKSDCLKEFEE